MIVMKDNNKQEEFEKMKRLNKCVRWVRTMKMVNASAWRLLNQHWLDDKPIESNFDGKFTTIKLPANKLFEEAYGEVKLIFEGNSTRQCDLYDVQPHQYFEDCFLGMPIIVHGVMIPDTPKDKFKIEFAYSRLNK